MKRDMDLCREILRRLEADPGQPRARQHASQPNVKGHSAHEVRYHLEIMYEAGLVWSRRKEAEKSLIGADFKTRQAHRPTTVPDDYRLTWAGHEFLEAARDDTRWNSVKRTVATTTGGLAFEFLRAVLMHKGKELLRLE